ncbi:type II secretion system F family protein [Patescibacteria group bacterium]|nr:type II secretion system F family protein [Patescibacteria group bacterium]
MEKDLSPFEQNMNSFITDHLTHIPSIQKMFFIEHLHTMIHAGLSLVESLETLSKEIENKKLKRVIFEIKIDIEKGKPLGETLSKHPKAFPPIYVKMIEAGELSGKLEESLKQVASQMEKNNKLLSSIRSAMVYPIVIITAMIAIGIMMVTVVLPKLTDLFKEFDAELPLATRALIAFTDFASKPLNLSIILISIIAIIFLFIFSLKKYPKFKKFIHNLNLHIPIFGKIIKKINLARFSLTLSSLLKSTIPIIDAVNITGDTCGNVIYRDFLKNTAEKIKTGTPLSEILREGDMLFPPMVTEMIMVGERTGEIDQLLEELANFYSSEVDKTMKNFATIIEPVIILILGLAVAGIAVAVIMPMYTLVQSF